MSARQIVTTPSAVKAQTKTPRKSNLVTFRLIKMAQQGLKPIAKAEQSPKDKLLKKFMTQLEKINDFVLKDYADRLSAADKSLGRREIMDNIHSKIIMLQQDAGYMELLGQNRNAIKQMITVISRLYDTYNAE